MTSPATEASPVGDANLGCAEEYSLEAGMTPQAMSELVNELVELGHVERKPDPADGRAKLIVLTRRGRAAAEAGQRAITGLESRITEVLGEEGHTQLRRC